ncbi:hypothetical protein [Promicromonospora sp. NPDC057488]|uniref:hypothetical protein n=1 Tax=Promicromonospora sp. NPDC057488 TaxID=3346147 RepID=UPI00366AB0E9
MTRLRGAVACLGVAVLLAVSLLPAGLAASRAGWPEPPSTAEELIAAAHAAAATDADRAALLAAEAYRLDPSPRSHAALLTVLDATSWIDQEADLDDLGDLDDETAEGGTAESETAEDRTAEGDVTAMTAAALSQEVVAGTSAGDVVLWDLTGAPQVVGSTGRWITELATGDTVTTVAALDVDGTVHLLRTGRLADDDTADPPFTSALDIAMSPTGLLLAALVEDDSGRHVEVRYTGTNFIVARADVDDGYDSVDLGDDYVVLSAQDSRLGEQGRWERRALDDLEVVGSGSVLTDVGFDGGLAATAATSPHGVVAATVHSLVTTLAATEDGSENVVGSPGLPATLDVRTVVFSPGATQYLAVRDQRNYVFDVPQGNAYWELRGARPAAAAAFTDENRLVTARGRTLTAWSLFSAGPRATVRSTEFDTRARRTVSPDGRYLLAAGFPPGGDGASIAIRYDLAPDGGADTGAEADTDSEASTSAEADAELPGLVGAVVPRDADPGTWLPVVTDDGTALVVRAEDGTVREAERWTSSATVDRDIERLTPDDFRATYAPPLRYETGLRDVLAARVSAGGELVLAAADGSVLVVDPVTGEVHHEATLRGGPWTAAEVAPDGRRVALVAGAKVGVVDPATGDGAARRLPVDGADPPALAFGDDALVVAHAGGVVVLDADDGAVRAASGPGGSGTGGSGTTASAVLPGPRSAAVLPGTGLAVVGGTEPTVVLVDLATGERAGEINMRTSAPALTAAPGRLLAIGSDTGNRRVVDRDTSAAALLATACAVAGRDLTAAEWTETVEAAPPSDLSCDRAR